MIQEERIVHAEFLRRQCWVCSRKSREARMAGEKRAKGKNRSEQGGRTIGNEVRTVIGKIVGQI